VSAWSKWLRQALTFGTSNKRVTFIQPFVLKGLDGVQPSGTYSVGTGLRPVGLFSFFKGMRASTWIRVCRNPGTAGVLQLANIDPLDLAAALIRDAVPAAGAETGVQAVELNEVWETEGGAIPRHAFADAVASDDALPTIEDVSGWEAHERKAAAIAISLSGLGTIVAAGRYPKFQNDLAVPEIRIGRREFNCIGASPPHDHPHVYINMGDRDTILCPYCATRYRYDARLGPFDAVPQDSFFADLAGASQSF